MCVRRLIALLVATMLAMAGSAALAQGAVQAGQSNDPASAPVSASSPACANEYSSLRLEAEKRGRLIKAAGDRHAPADETCKLIGNYVQAELKMIRYVEQHAATCGIATQVSDRLRNGHRSTDAQLKKICSLAQQLQTRGPAGPTGDFEQPVVR
jgi:hypothetical protein